MTDFSTTHLATNVLSRREYLRMSRESLARETGVSVAAIKRIEQGESCSTVGVLMELCAALGRTPDELLRGGGGGIVTDRPRSDVTDDVTCGARTLYAEKVYECQKPHTHAGAHRFLVEDGRVFSWEPIPPADTHPTGTPDIGRLWELLVEIRVEASKDGHPAYLLAGKAMDVLRPWRPVTWPPAVSASGDSGRTGAVTRERHQGEGSRPGPHRPAQTPDNPSRDTGGGVSGE